MPIYYRKDEVFKLPNDDKKRLKIYDEIILNNLLRNRDENNQVVNVELRIILTPTDIIMYQAKEPLEDKWFKDSAADTPQE